MNADPSVCTWPKLPPTLLERFVRAQSISERRTAPISKFDTSSLERSRHASSWPPSPWPSTIPRKTSSRASSPSVQYSTWTANSCHDNSRDLSCQPFPTAIPSQSHSALRSSAARTNHARCRYTVPCRSQVANSTRTPTSQCLIVCTAIQRADLAQPSSRFSRQCK